MNNLQKELQELKAKVAELESRISAEPVKWQPKSGKYYAECLSTTTVFHRETKEQAKRASVEMRRFNRLLALRDELCGDEVINWDWTDGKEKHQLYFSHNHGQWLVSADFYCECVMPYFTNYDSAQKACDMLNSGEVEL